MRRPPLIITPGGFAGSSVHVEGEVAHHALYALRLGVGDVLRISDGSAAVVTARITDTARHAFDAEITARESLLPEPAPAVELIQILPKPALADKVVGPATALGAAALRFVRGDRTPVTADWEERVPRWQRLACSAAEQSERARMPDITVSESLAQCFADFSADHRLLADEATDTHASGITGTDLRAHHRIQLIVGPEGGITDGERAACAPAGCAPISLGAHVLRLELAALVALTITMHELGRLS